VRKADGAFVSFDVWRYEGDTLRRQFLKDIASRLKDGKCLDRSYKPSEALRDLDVDVAVPEEHLRISGRNLLVSAIAFALTFSIAFAFFHFQVESRTGIKTSRSEISADALLSFILGAIAVLFTQVNRVIRVDQRIISQKRIEEPERFVEKFEELLGAVKKKRLVIAMDNLDRCSPELADEMLATIKTYLEPSVVRGDQCEVAFLIAVDDAALRRHLVARELETRSANAIDPKNERDAAESYVDEYLRKFFMGTLRVKPLLDEEMRTYTARQLAPLIDAYGLSGADAVTPLVASALRHNPRRVKQFANSLETRLRLIRAREQSGLITRRDDAPLLSSHIAQVAKLAVIEEIFPHRYEELEKDPRLLVTWQNTVIAGEELDDKDPDFAAFLRTTRDVAIEDIYPLLRLRQSEAERELPDYTRFKEAIVLGALPEAAEIVQRSDADQQLSYGRRVVDLLDEEVSWGSREGAFNVLDAAFGANQLELADEVRREMAVTAVQIPGLRDQLWRLDASSVLSVRPLLEQVDRDRLTEAFLRLDVIGERAPDRLGPTAAALSSLVNELSPQETDTLRETLASDNVVRRFDDYLTLARTKPDLLSDRNVREAYDLLVSMGPSVQLDGAQGSVMALGLSVGREPEVGNQFARQLSTFLISASTIPDNLIESTEHASELVAQIPSLDDSVVHQTLVELQGQYSPLTSASGAAHTALLELVGELADRVADPSVETSNAVDWFVDKTFEAAPHDALAYLKSPPRPIPKAIRRRASEQLVQLVRSNLHDLRAPAGVELLAISDEGPTHLYNLASEFIRANDFASAGAVISAWREELPSTSDLGALYVAQMKAVAPTDRKPALESLPAIVPILDAAQWIHVWEALGEMLETRTAEPIASAIDAATRLRAFDESGLRDLVRRAARHLYMKTFDTTDIELLRWVCGSGDCLDSAERGALLAQLDAWLQETANAPYAAQIATAAAPFQGLTADQRAEFVGVLVRAEARHPDPTARATLLAAADVAKLKSRRGADALRERLTTLESSSDPDDQRVAQEFDALESP
jgi:hypothetical protein